MEVIPEKLEVSPDILLSVNGCLAAQGLTIRLWLANEEHYKKDTYGSYYPNKKVPVVATFQLLEYSEDRKSWKILHQSPMLYSIFDFIRAEFGQRKYESLNLKNFDNLFLYDRDDDFPFDRE